MSQQLPVEFISEKQQGRAHEEGQIRDFLTAYMNGDVPDYQMTAWLMAVYFQGMDERETVELTDVMLHSGATLTHGTSLPLGDKHSTGGVGDKITLLLAPLVAAAGIGIPTISGRGLGFTGGTLDKLESIPGMRTDLTVQQMQDQVANLGAAFGAQTKELVPADQKLYALRDVTSTVRSLPLITSSILSKKAAEGLDAIVYDVKCGHGAFMENVGEARELAGWLVRVSERFGVRAAALVTTMDAPLGFTVGNWLEAEESARALRGDGVAEDIRDLTLALGGTMLALTGAAQTPAKGIAKVEEVWDAGEGFRKLQDTVNAQQGDPASLEAGAAPHKARATLEVRAPRSGHVAALNARAVGYAGVAIGAGRRKATDNIDPAAGFEVHVHPGDEVREGDRIATVHAASDELCREGERRVLKALEIVDEAPEVHPLLRMVVTADGEQSWEQFRERDLSQA